MIIVFADFYSCGPRSVVFRKTVDTGGTSAFNNAAAPKGYAAAPKVYAAAPKGYAAPPKG